MSLRYSDESIRDLLLKKANKDSIQCLEEAPQWIQALSTSFADDLGLLSLHGPKGLSEHLPPQPAVRIPLCAVDNMVMLLARRAHQSNQHIGIAFPAGPVMLPMLIVCKTVLGDLLSRQSELEKGVEYRGLKRKGGILLVSPDSEVRARYFSMRVGNESVVTAYEACRMRPDGTIAPFIAKQTGLPAELFSVCFFLAHHRQMPKPEDVTFKPSVILLDFAHDRWVERRDQILEWCLQLRDRDGETPTVITMLPFGDSRSREALEKHQVPVFPVDATFISDLSEGFQPVKPAGNEIIREAYRSWSFSAFALENPLDRSHRIYLVPEDLASTTIETVYSIHGALNAVSDRDFGRDLRLATWLVGTLMQLPVPVQWYEQHAFLMGNRQTLKKLISSIGESGKGTLNAHLAPTLQALRGNLDLLYTRLSNRNPKSVTFLNHFREHLQPLLEAGKKVALVCRNDVIARALWPWMQSEEVAAEHQENLHILTFKQIDGRELFDLMISTGPWPARYRWQLGGRLGREMNLLCYRGEEIIIERQLRYFYGAKARNFLTGRRFTLLKKWTIITDEPNYDTHLESDAAVNLSIDSERLTPEQVTEPREITTSQQGYESYEFDDDEPDSKSLFDVVVIQSQDLGLPSVCAEKVFEQLPPIAIDRPLYDDIDLPDEEEQVETLVTTGPTEACLGLKVRMTSSGPEADDDQYIYLSTDGAIECFIPSQQDEGLTTVDTDEIEPGFILLRTDRDDRRGLFDRIVQLADSQPTMKYLKVWRQHWREAIDSLAGKHISGRARRGTYKALHEDLKRTGIDVALVTVRTWVLGQTIGPGSLHSIKAVGALSKHPMVEQYPEQIDAAFKQIRIIHQALGRRISRVLQRVGQKSQVGPGKLKKTGQEVQLDPALSVPIDDLIDMLQFWEVVEVSNGPWEVPTAHVNVVLPKPLYGE